MLDWRQHTDDIQELISEIHSSADLANFVEELKEGLEDDDIKINEENAIIYHGVKLDGKKELRRFFTLQREIPGIHNTFIIKMLKQTEYKSQFADSVNKFLNDTDAVRVFHGKLQINNKIYNEREDIFNDFKQELSLDDIAQLCNHYEYTPDNCGIVCDGIALITTSRQYLNSSVRKSYPLEGFIDNTHKLFWEKVDKSAFMEQEVKEDNIKIYALRGFQDTSYTFYETVLTNTKSIVQKPYPVAIFPNDIYVFYYKKNAPLAKRRREE